MMHYFTYVFAKDTDRILREGMIYQKENLYNKAFVLGGRAGFLLTDTPIETFLDSLEMNIEKDSGNIYVLKIDADEIHNHGHRMEWLRDYYRDYETEHLLLYKGDIPAEAISLATLREDPCYDYHIHRDPEESIVLERSLYL